MPTSFPFTHPRGVRRFRVIYQGSKAGFHSRTRVGCDLSHCIDAVGHADVSIHAPAWGATVYKPRSDTPHSRFHSRTRVGCDLIDCIVPGAPLSCFHSRTRVGCDLIDCTNNPAKIILEFMLFAQSCMSPPPFPTKSTKFRIAQIINLRCEPPGKSCSLQPRTAASHTPAHHNINISPSLSH